MEGLREGETLIFKHVSTNELYCAAGDVYDSLKPLRVSVCARRSVCLCVLALLLAAERSEQHLIFKTFYMLLFLPILPVSSTYLFPRPFPLSPLLRAPLPPFILLHSLHSSL